MMMLLIINSKGKESDDGRIGSLERLSRKILEPSVNIPF